MMHRQVQRARLRPIVWLATCVVLAAVQLSLSAAWFVTERDNERMRAEIRRRETATPAIDRKGYSGGEQLPLIISNSSITDDSALLTVSGNVTLGKRPTYHDRSHH